MATTTLKILREIKGYKQEEIAEVLGISQNTYSRLERAPQNLSVEQAQKLADFYNVDVDDLVSESAPTILFSHNTIESSNNGIVKNVENDNRKSVKEDVLNSLKEEIEYLRKQNLELVKAIASLKS